jgi:hypothetical protein
MIEAKPTTDRPSGGDLVLREVWGAKDALSAARGHSVERLFADLRAREKCSGHKVVNLSKPAANKAKA